MPAAAITAVILAGGRARRMGGADKGLLQLHGKALVQHVIERIRPQVDALLINANRNQAAYENFGVPVVSDTQQNFAGPLAGIAAALRHCTTPYLLVVPCDTPFLPDTLVAALLARLQGEAAEVCLAHDGQRLQPLVALMSCALKDELERSIAAGHLKVEHWMTARRHCIARFDAPERFININNRDELSHAEEFLTRHSGIRE